MGMYDYFRSSYDLGPHCTEIECQTKDIDDFGGGTMSQYWLDPAGYLYFIDYTGTQDYYFREDRDVLYHLPLMEIKPNGNKGKVTPCLITKYIEIYPSKLDISFTEIPTLRLNIKYGRLMEYDDITRYGRR